MDELPEDIIVIIFSNLDVKTLLSLRFTCRQWHQIINGSCFGRQLAEKQNLKKGVVQQPMLLIFYPNHNPSSDDDHHRILNPNPNPNNKDERVLEIDLNLFPWPNWHSNNNKDPLLFESCANGIFCFTRNSSCTKSYLVNPLRKEILELPPLNIEPPPRLKYRYCYYGLGFDKLKRKYKIVCAVIDCYKDSIIFTFYTLKESKWVQLITKLPSQYVPLRCPIWIDNKGVMYWICFDPYGNNIDYDHNRYMVMALHLEKEEFRFVSFNKGEYGYSYSANTQLVDLNNGVLSLVYYLEYDTEIWNLINVDEKENWVKMYKIENSRKSNYVFPYNIHHQYYYCHYHDLPYNEVIGPWENGEVLIRCRRGTFMAYNPSTNTFKKLNFSPIDHTKFCYSNSYTPSLASVSWIQDHFLN
ncbi:F-box protein At5g42460-like [Cannabis sativa]|uniref:F-box protein At5g42460-like n=1 Tax=Cannabis sativa TaxID=3483 RepID=UPI0029C9C173|nr:F-box protein At5g42460-like [Cannabis sativa]